MQILRVNHENLMHISKVLSKRDFTNLHRNMIMTMCTAVCDANSESKMNIVVRINACKFFFTCPCPCPFHYCCYYFWCLFNYPGHGTSWSSLFWRVGTHYTFQVNPSSTPHFRFGSLEETHTQTLGIEYLILYLIYSGSTSLHTCSC